MKNKHLPLIIGISLPLIFILVISIVVFSPSLFVKPQHNFLYTTENDYYGYNQAHRNTYKVEGNRIALDPIPSRVTDLALKEAPTVYLYNVQTDSSHQITFEEAQKYSLDPGPSSPDGYTINYEHGHDGIFELFGSYNENRGYFISKGNGKKKIAGLAADRYWNQGEFKLIGWVK